MARTAIVPIISVTPGIAVVAVAAIADGHQFPNDERTVLVVDNASASPTTLTIATTATVDGFAVADLSVVVAAGTRKVFGPFRQSTFGTTIAFDFSAITDVSFDLVTV